MKNTKENVLVNSNCAISLFVGDLAYELISKAKYFFEGKYVSQIKNILGNKNFPCKGAIVVKIKKIVSMH